MSDVIAEQAVLPEIERAEDQPIPEADDSLGSRRTRAGGQIADELRSRTVEPVQLKAGNGFKRREVEHPVVDRQRLGLGSAVRCARRVFGVDVERCERGPVKRKELFADGAVVGPKDELIAERRQLARKGRRGAELDISSECWRIDAVILPELASLCRPARHEIQPVAGDRELAWTRGVRSWIDVGDQRHGAVRVEAPQLVAADAVVGGEVQRVLEDFEVAWGRARRARPDFGDELGDWDLPLRAHEAALGWGQRRQQREGCRQNRSRAPRETSGADLGSSLQIPRPALQTAVLDRARGDGNCAASSPLV